MQLLNLKTWKTSHHLIKDQSVLYSLNRVERKKIKTTIKTERENIHKNVLNTLQNRLNENQLRLNSVSR